MGSVPERIKRTSLDLLGASAPSFPIRNSIKQEDHKMGNIVKLEAGQTVLVAATMPGQGPDQGLPTPPDLGLAVPSHPIVLPPDPTQPIPPPTPTHPIAGLDPKPSHPIVLPQPGEIPPKIPPGNTPGWKPIVAWTPVTGWIVVAVPTGPTPTPSRK